MMEPPRLVVVAAVVGDAGRFLVTRRQSGAHLEGYWEFPGGKIDSGESFADGLRRELREELDTDADVGKEIFTVAHDYPDRTVELHFFACRLHAAPTPQLGQEMRWVAREELRTLRFLAADDDLIARLS